MATVEVPWLGPASTPAERSGTSLGPRMRPQPLQPFLLKEVAVCRPHPQARCASEPRRKEPAEKIVESTAFAAASSTKAAAISGNSEITHPMVFD